MITARLLNQDARLNDYQQIGGISYVNGDTIRVVIQLFNDELGVRHIPILAATVSLGVNFSDGTIQDTATNSNNIPMTVLDADDRSIWMVDIVTNDAGANLSPTLASKTLVGGNITFRLAGDTNSIGSLKQGIIFNALQRDIVS